MELLGKIKITQENALTMCISAVFGGVMSAILAVVLREVFWSAVMGALIALLTYKIVEAYLFVGESEVKSPSRSYRPHEERPTIPEIPIDDPVKEQLATKVAELKNKLAAFDEEKETWSKKEADLLSYVDKAARKIESLKKELSYLRGTKRAAD